MLHFLSGEDTFRVRVREDEFVDAFRKHSPLGERLVLDAEENESAPGSFSRALRESLQAGLFALPRVILLRQTGALSEESAKAVRDILKESFEGSDLLIIATHRGKIKRTQTLVAWLLKKAECESFDPLSPRELAIEAKALLKKIDARGSIEPAALSQLVANVGTDTGKIFQELTKLAHFKDGKPITQDDVKELTNEPLESNVFLALDALVQGRRGAAISLLRQEERMSVPIQKTLGLCAWQLRRLIEIQELFLSGTREAGAIARELKSSPYPIQKVLPHLSRFEMPRLKRGMALLAELDLAIKTGRAEPGVALDLFLWKF